MSKINVWQSAWYGDTEMELDFPSSWEVTLCPMRGHDWPPLSPEQIKEVFSKPIGTGRIGELARGKKEVAILFDDLTRPTPVAELVPYVLEELEAAGIPDDSIRFIVALGAHRALSRLDFVKKLGEAVVERFPVFSHNPYENCTFVGETSRGTPVSINSEVMSCDLKIGIGSIVPHAIAAFGGGGKIVLPGVASMDTIAANHALVARARAKGRSGWMTYGLGFEENEVRLDIAEAARMAGLDVKIDAILNVRREITALFVGDPVAEHLEGVKLAKEVYATERVEGMDIVIANAYAKDTEPYHASPMAAQMLGEKGGDLVIIVNAPDGLVPHYLVGTWGRDLGARLWQRRRRPLPQVNRTILFTRYIDKGQCDRIAPLESLVWAKTWEEVIRALKESHPGPARVAVIPDATIQYVPE